MDAGARSELQSIKTELRSIIAELESISNGVRYDFQGIGSDRCANSIDHVIERYRTALRKLNNLDTNTVMEWYAKAHPADGAKS